MKYDIFLYSNETDLSTKVKINLENQLNTLGYSITDSFSDMPKLAICIGGDGTFLKFLHTYDFPETPILGVNTGKLGFYQEVLPEKIDIFLKNYELSNYKTQPLNPIKATVYSKNKLDNIYSLNEIAIKTEGNYPTHLNVSIDGEHIEKYSGDGILIATPSGSTAYNYSLGGSLVDPRLKLLQVTPIAAMNSSAYRSFTSSILLPHELDLTIKPELRAKQQVLNLCYDGLLKKYDNIEKIVIRLSSKQINLLRYKNYDFWSKVKSRFL